MKDWDDVVAYTCSLPEVEMASWWGTLCPKINGKGFMSPGREKGSFALSVTNPEKEILFETDPGTFWQTAHYENWPGVLVRFASADPERVRDVIRRAWWDRASKAQRLVFGERP